MADINREEFDNLVKEYVDLKETIINVIEDQKQMKAEMVEIRMEHDRLREELALARYILNNMTTKSDFLN